MDAMIQTYMEETEDMLQRAEECIIRLEMEYSSVDINELFRIAHTIKGSSHLVGYEDIGNLMHSIEDLLDCVRKDAILFDQRIVSISFDGLDIVKRILKGRAELCSEEVLHEYGKDASRICKIIESFINTNKKDTVINDRTVMEQEETGVVSALLKQKPRGRNKYYITIFIEEDAPMISPVLMMIMKAIEDIGTLIYSGITDSHLNESNTEIRTFDMILCTDVEEVELYTYFALFYVEKINVINLNRSVVESNDYYFSEPEHTTYIILMKAIMKLYQLAFQQCNDSKEEELYIKKLQRETTNAISRINNMESSKRYSMEFNRLFNQTKKILKGKTKGNEKGRTINQGRVIKLIERLYNETKGRYIVRIICPERDNFMNRLKSFLGTVKKSTTLIILIDISKLNRLHEDEVKELIEINKELMDQGIESEMVANGPVSRRIINIFDSIKEIYDFKVYPTELDAILGIFHREDSFHKLMERIELIYP
jgi:two-component system chemotaxis sensor kinase CheA